MFLERNISFQRFRSVFLVLQFQLVALLLLGQHFNSGRSAYRDVPAMVSINKGEWMNGRRAFAYLLIWNRSFFSFVRNKLVRLGRKFCSSIFTRAHSALVFFDLASFFVNSAQSVSV